MQRTHSLSSENLPIAEALFARLIRATPHEIRELTRTMSEGERAQLALFCNARAHLRSLGYEMARTCSENGLLREGGQAGLSLFAQAKSDLGSSSQSSRLSTRPVSLARFKSAAETAGRDLAHL